MSDEQWRLIRHLRLKAARRAALMAQDNDDDCISVDEIRELGDTEYMICELANDLLATFGPLPSG